MKKSVFAIALAGIGLFLSASRAADRAEAITIQVPQASAAAAAADSTNQWGYGYDSLLADLARWRKDPNVRIDSIGASVQGRAIWMVSITDHGDSLGPVDDSSSKKHRVMIHARTHPAEVQAFYIARETIAMLLDSGSKAEEMRRAFIFNIIPMYNPDGVELGHDRLNAHLVDLEGNWDKGVLEPEVAALKKQFEAFQASPVPIEVALNLHSDQYNCTRFFFFHVAAGTSAAYENLERSYISGVQGYFPGGIKNWNFITSWGDGTQLRYPEGFWWSTQKEKVLALTYEDANCPNATRFDSTGRALALGSGDYIRARMVASLARAAGWVSRTLLLREGVRVEGLVPGTRWEVVDLRGRRLAGGALIGGDAALISWEELPAAPFRILSIVRPSGLSERVRLPVHPD
jgi:hypothetical protein